MVGYVNGLSATRLVPFKGMPVRCRFHAELLEHSQSLRAVVDAMVDDLSEGDSISSGSTASRSESVQFKVSAIVSHELSTTALVRMVEPAIWM